MPALPQPQPANKNSTAYQLKKETSARRSRLASAAGRDIGSIPPVKDPNRKSKASRDYRYFCEVYFPRQFYLPWSNDHLRIMSKIEYALHNLSCFAMAMPRGSGKTTLCEIAAIYSMLNGLHKFTFLIGSTQSAAEMMMTNIKVSLSTNELLLEDYPESLYPIWCLEGETRRASGQLHHGLRTRIGWTADQIVLPTIPGAVSSGCLVKVAGITGQIRGAKYMLPDGRSIRPSLAILDDPQTDESAKSPTQCEARLATINGAIKGLAGPDRPVAMIMPCTVIKPNDLADQVLDRTKNPEWQGIRTKMVYKFPTNEKLWDKYAEIRSDSLINDGDGSEATEFYHKNREAMDKGAEVAWPERFDPKHAISGIQYAINLKLTDETAFWAEYQNEPLPDIEEDEGLLTADQIAAKTNNYNKGTVLIGCTQLTMFIDVQSKCHYYLVAAWQDDFTGYVIDYGTDPDQKQAYFAHRDAKRTLGRAAPGAGEEGAIYAGLERITNELLGKEWRREDGALIRIDKCLIDANWGKMTDVVYQFCRQSQYAGVIIPSHGRYVGASSIPFSEYKRKRGDKIGHNWRIPNVTGKRAIRHVIFDTNYWKSFVHARLSVHMGDSGCLSLFGKKPERHRLLAEHLTAEYRVKTEGRGRTVDEWKLRVDGIDNHWLDCLVGSAVAASIQSVSLQGLVGGSGGYRRIAKKRVKLSELRKANR